MVTQKELVDPSKLVNCLTAVIDVFLATSTISFLLDNKYEPIYAMNGVENAKCFARNHNHSYMLLGESKGKTVKDFIYPDPSLIEPVTEKCAAIISSTNGTKAINKAKTARKMYISSIVNGHIISERLHAYHKQNSIVLICAGNDNRFSLEDFVGAGQIINYLMKKGDYILSDSAILAQETFLHAELASFKNLYTSETATLLQSFHYKKAIDFVLNNVEKVDVVPVYENGKIVNERNI